MQRFVTKVIGLMLAQQSKGAGFPDNFPLEPRLEIGTLILENLYQAAIFSIPISSLNWLYGILQTNIRRGSGRCFLLDFDKKQQENQFSSCDYPC